MTKKFLTTITFSLFTCFLFSQDTIYKTDGSMIIAKILEINSNSVKYKFVDDNGTVIETSKDKIARINYHNGLKEIYDTSSPKKEMNADKSKKETYVDEPTAKSDVANLKNDIPYLKNIIAVNLFEMAFTNFSCSYERIFAAGKIGLKVPFSFGMGGKQNNGNYNPNDWFNFIYQTNKKFGTGLEFNYYPGGQSRNTFYVGASALIGSFTYYQDIYDTTTNYSNGYPYTTSSLKEKVSHTGIQYAGTIHLGCYFGLSKNLILGGKFGVGYKKEDTIYEDFTHPKLQFDINLGYRF